MPEIKKECTCCGRFISEGSARSHGHRTWFLERGELKEDLVLHHIDENPWNNEIENLKPMTKSDHSRLHALGRQQKERNTNILGYKSWIDRRKTLTFSLRLDDFTNLILNQMAITTKSKKSDLIRKSLYFMRILLDPDLTLKDIIEGDIDPNRSLGEQITPIPILASKITLEMDMFEIVMDERDKKNEKIEEPSS